MDRSSLQAGRSDYQAHDVAVPAHGALVGAELVALQLQSETEQPVATWPGCRHQPTLGRTREGRAPPRESIVCAETGAASMRP